MHYGTSSVLIKANYWSNTLDLRDRQILLIWTPNRSGLTLCYYISRFLCTMSGTALHISLKLDLCPIMLFRDIIFWQYVKWMLHVDELFVLKVSYVWKSFWNAGNHDAWSSLCVLWYDDWYCQFVKSILVHYIIRRKPCGPGTMIDIVSFLNLSV